MCEEEQEESGQQWLLGNVLENTSRNCQITRTHSPVIFRDGSTWNRFPLHDDEMGWGMGGYVLSASAINMDLG